MSSKDKAWSGITDNDSNNPHLNVILVFLNPQMTQNYYQNVLESSFNCAFFSVLVHPFIRTIAKNKTKKQCSKERIVLFSLYIHPGVILTYV